MSKLFEIPITGGESFDVTPMIVLNTYNVSNQSIYDEWTDGYYHERRGVKRKKLKGSFSVKFFNVSDYQNFLSNIENGKVDGFDYIVANVYDNKSRTVVSAANVYVDFEPINVEPSIGFSFNEEIEIEITEV